MGRSTKKKIARKARKSAAHGALMQSPGGASKYAAKNSVRRSFKDGTSNPSRDPAGNYVDDAAAE